MSRTLESETVHVELGSPAPAGSPFGRMLDVVIAGALLLLFAPIGLLLGLAALCGAVRFEAKPRIGRAGNSFRQLSVSGHGRVGRVVRRLRLDGWPVLWNVLAGEMALVGPRALSPGDPLWDEPGSAERLSVRPGLVSPWWLRRRANIDYQSEIEADIEYVATRSLKRDLGILARVPPALLMSPPPAATPREARLMGFRIDNLSMDEAVQEIVRRADAEKPSQVCFINADCVNIACRDPQYRRVLQDAPLALADGIGMRLAARLHGGAIRQNLNGTDLFPQLCAAVAGTGRGIFLLGARPGVAEAVRDWVDRNIPGVDIRGCRDGYFSADEEPAVLAEIAASGAAILLVAFGAPRQDVWISRHLHESGVKVALGVGGLFDYYSGRIPRAPQWVRELCLEWLYRVYQEPRRLWKRYFLGNGLFLWRVAKARLFG